MNLCEGERQTKAQTKYQVSATAIKASYSPCTLKGQSQGRSQYYFNARWFFAVAPRGHVDNIPPETKREALDDPTIGRFMSEDPARDGVNWYAYCDNNPMSYTDPTGLEKHTRSELRDNISNAPKPKEFVASSAGMPSNLRDGGKPSETYIHPIKSGYITSAFGERKNAVPKKHNALDYALPGGASCDVLACADGEVVSAGKRTDIKEYGFQVKVKHPDGKETTYSHLKEGSIKVEKGNIVKQGQTLAEMGGSGGNFGVHLDLEMRDSKGVRIDPYPVLSPSNNPDIKIETSAVEKSGETIKNK